MDLADAIIDNDIPRVFRILDNEPRSRIQLSYDHSVMTAAQFGHVTLLQQLLERGANIHSYGNMALIQAARNGHLGVVQELMNRGIDIHTNNDQALNEAVVSDSLDIVQYLLDHGPVKRESMLKMARP